MQTEMFDREYDRSKGVMVEDDKGNIVHYKSLNSFCKKHGIGYLTAIKKINFKQPIGGYTVRGVPKTNI